MISFRKLKKLANPTSALVLCLYLLVVVGCFYFFKEPSFANWKEEVSFLQKTGQYEKAEVFLGKLLGDTCHSIEKHYAYISNHFKIPVETKVEEETRRRDDEDIELYYESILSTSDSQLVSIRFYGLGLIASYQENYESAAYFFDQVKDTTLPYVYNSKGYLQKQHGQLKEAMVLFKKELSFPNGNFASAYLNVFNILMNQQRYDEFLALSKDPQAREHIPLHELRRVCIIKHEPLLYVLLSFRHDFEHAHILGFIAATAIMLFWLVYLRQIDIFEPEKWKYLWLALAMGILFSFGALPLYDLVEQLWGFELNGDLLNDLLYCIFGIGIIEELVKILPLLVLLWFPKITNEPFDYVLYASVSALGFSYMENIMYFDEYNMDILHGRATYSTVFHMVDSSIIAYGLYMNHLVWKKPTWLIFPAFLLIAATAHGLYDFFLVNETASVFSILTTCVFISGLCIWNSIKTNALNHSHFFDENVEMEMEKLNRYLICGLFALMSYEFFALSWVTGASYAFKKALLSIFATLFIFYFLFERLTHFNLSKGKMWPIKYFPTKENH